jgi:hypothetical protein
MKVERLPVGWKGQVCCQLAREVVGQFFDRFMGPGDCTLESVLDIEDHQHEDDEDDGAHLVFGSNALKVSRTPLVLVSAASKRI